MVLRKISLKIACKLAIKIETVSCVSKTRIAWAKDRFYIYTY